MLGTHLRVSHRRILKESQNPETGIPKMHPSVVPSAWSAFVAVSSRMCGGCVDREQRTQVIEAEAITNMSAGGSVYFRSNEEKVLGLVAGKEKSSVEKHSRIEKPPSQLPTSAPHNQATGPMSMSTQGSYTGLTTHLARCTQPMADSPVRNAVIIEVSSVEMLRQLRKICSEHIGKPHNCREVTLGNETVKPAFCSKSILALIPTAASPHLPRPHHPKCEEVL
jgi:hypothetical protein